MPALPASTSKRRLGSHAAILLLLLFGAFIVWAASDEPATDDTNASTASQTSDVKAIATASADWLGNNWSEVGSTPYAELVVNIDRFGSKILHLGGMVTNVIDVGNDSYQLHVSITKDGSEWSGPIVVHHTGIRIFEGEVIQFVGVVNGTRSYESDLDNDTAFPDLTSNRLKVIDTEHSGDRADSDTRLTSDLDSGPDPAKTQAPATAFGTGTWRVGTDIEPGTYFAHDSDKCYWQRLSGLSGTPSDLVENGSAHGRVFVEILSSDAAFDSYRCGEWILVSGMEIPEPVTAFDDGIWRVGTDIEPGMYTAPGSAGCYWERLSGFSGTGSEIIENGNPDGPVNVDILESDAGFGSTRCGDWDLVPRAVPLHARLPQDRLGAG